MKRHFQSKITIKPASMTECSSDKRTCEWYDESYRFRPYCVHYKKKLKVSNEGYPLRCDSCLRQEDGK